MLRNEITKHKKYINSCTPTANFKLMYNGKQIVICEWGKKQKTKKSFNINMKEKWTYNTNLEMNLHFVH